MQSPEIPANEQQRLQALQDFNLLDTSAEERFDRLTRLARHIFDVPIALVSLVDADRQWFKSRQGLDVCEIGRDISFCGHALLGQDIFEVTDASQDPRFATNPLVTGSPHIRFYAGAPLITAGGCGIGTLCIIDRRPGRLKDSERQALRDLGASVMSEVERSRLLNDSGELSRNRKLYEVIANIQKQFIIGDDRARTFDDMLESILELTDSEYGFIGEVLHTTEGAPHLKTYAITNIAWNDETRALYAANADNGIEFSNTETLFGAALCSGEPVIANDPGHDPRRSGLPPGHPALNAFLGIPVHHGDELVAMLGVANRTGGYDEGWVSFLAPLMATLGQLVVATRLKQANRKNQRELARLSQVASQTTNGVIITDLEGRAEWINEGFTRLSGYTLDQIQGRKPGNLLQGEETDPAVVEQMRLGLNNEEAFEVDVVNYHRNGERYWVHILCNPIFDEAGTRQGYIAIENDVTRQKQIEQMKDEFVATVSHELRTPLTAISGALGLVVGGSRGEMPEALRRMLTIAQSNSQRLELLVNDLLDMEKLMAGKVEFRLEEQALQPLLEQAIKTNQPYADKFGVSLRLTENPGYALIRIDSHRFQQVMANLLSNAAKFSPAGGEVDIMATIHGDAVLVSVTDQGPGIPPGFRDQIFQKFAQADSTNTRRSGGTGLGLAISRDLVEGMGGSIGFDSVHGQGTTFWLEFALIRQHAVTSA